MKNTGRQVKDALYAQVTRIGKAVCSPKRLELIELLCQGEKPVERLAAEAEISMKLASAHLKELRQAHLVETRREGKNIFYRLTGESVADFWVAMRALAEDRLLELRAALAKLAEHAHELMPMEREELLAQAEQGEVVVLDVRPGNEFAAGHLPFARSLPLEELQQRLAELPRDKPVVAYCRGRYCVLSFEAVARLRQAGFQARRIEDGIPRWMADEQPLEGVQTRY